MNLPPLTHVYVIQSGENGPVKIGIAKNPETRVADLQTGNPEKLRLIGSSRVHDIDAPWIEKLIHGLLAEYRLQGEWFELWEAVESAALCIAMGSIHHVIKEAVELAEKEANPQGVGNPRLSAFQQWGTTRARLRAVK